jgi:hypothetical protein
MLGATPNAFIRRRGLHRRFDRGVLERPAPIVVGRAAGFSLVEIALMFAPDGRPLIGRQMLGAKAEELDWAICKSIAMRDDLRHAAVCPAPSLMECPNLGYARLPNSDQPTSIKHRFIQAKGGCPSPSKESSANRASARLTGPLD